MLTRLQSFLKRKFNQKYKFNLQYEAGKWDGLKELPELARYSVITGYVRYFCPNARVLDLGCGEGVLLHKLAPTDYTQYLGIDFSDIAIANAGKIATAKATFEVGDLNKWQTAEEYDAIIYNESLYYLSNPRQAVSALFPSLADNGIFIVSMVDHHGRERQGLWQLLNEILAPVDKTKVTNKAGDSWTIYVYKKPPQALGAAF